MTYIINFGLPIISLLISLITLIELYRDRKINNNQFLFERRLEIYTLLVKLKKLEESNKFLFSKKTTNYFYTGILVYLTNCSELESMANVLSNLEEEKDKNHIAFLTKKEWLIFLSETADLTFESPYNVYIAEYLLNYAELLHSIYRYHRFMKELEKETKMPLTQKLNEQEIPHQEIINQYNKLLDSSKLINLNEIKKENFLLNSH